MTSENSTGFSHWNYRVVRKSHTHQDGTIEFTYDVHEVHYDADGDIRSWTTNPVGPSGKDLSELRADLIRMHQTAMMTIAGDLPLLKEEELPGYESKSDQNDK